MPARTAKVFSNGGSQAIRLPVEARRVEGFPVVAVTLPWDEAAADAHGRLRALLRQQGTPIGVYDEMIAAHALAIGATVVTKDRRHFSVVPGLPVENWLRVGS